MTHVNSCACSSCANLEWIDVQPIVQYRQVLDIPLTWQEQGGCTMARYEATYFEGEKCVASPKTSSSGNSLQIPTESLSAKIDTILRTSAECEKKQRLGELLYPLVQQLQFELAGKITGMLLELKNDDICHLITEPAHLKSKVDEAVAVLQAHMAKQLYASKMSTISVHYEPSTLPQAPLTATLLGAYLRHPRPGRKSKKHRN